MDLTFTENNKTRLDKFLNERLPLSRSQIQKLIKSGDITVNNEAVTPHHFLQSGDTITYNEKEIAQQAEKKPFTPNKEVQFSVVAETDDYLIIDKPAGLMVHPTEHMENDTLANGLIARYPEIAEIGDDPVRPGIVHRLDKGVSGLMLVAKTQEAFEFYKHQLKGREVEKEYTALVYGEMEQPSGTIDQPISRSKSQGRMATRSQGQGGKEAITHYSVIQEYRNFSLLSVKIETGRTHQIRTHLHAIGHGVVGDPLYQQKNIKESAACDRIFLHSSTLSFTDQDGERKEYASPLPTELEEVLHTLTEK